jgi:EAL domain-containing protein (putative c-di-GMP-specific phosphodiesterase class I)
VCSSDLNTGQGYLFARPVPPAEVPQLLDQYTQLALEQH